MKTTSMGKMVMLSYDFMFDIDSTWPNGYSFEADLAKFLNEHGMDGEIVKTMEGMSGGRRMIHIVKKPEPIAPPPQQQPLNQSQAPKVQMQALTKDYPNRRQRRRFLEQRNG